MTTKRLLNYFIFEVPLLEEHLFKVFIHYRCKENREDLLSSKAIKAIHKAFAVFPTEKSMEVCILIDYNRRDLNSF